MNYFSSNLKYLREKNGMEQLDLAKRLGRKSSSSVSEWEKGLYSPKAGTLSDIASIFGVTLSDLMEKDLTQLPVNLTEVQPSFVKIPIIGAIACGDPITAEQNIEGYTYELTDYLPSGTIFALIAKGDSMEPTIPNGCKVLIREQPDCESGEIAAVLVNGDSEATLKRIRKQGETIILSPDNPKYEPILVDKENPARIIGKAIRVIKDLI